MAWSQDKRMAAELFQSFDETSVALALDDRPALLPYATASSAVMPSAVDELSSSSLQIMAERLVDPDRPFLPTGYRSSSPLSRRLTALDLSAPDIDLDTSPEGGRIAEFFLLAVRRLRCQICRGDEEL